MKFEYQLLILEPDIQRGERITVGVIAYKDGIADVRMPPTLPKLRAIDPAFTPRAMEDAKARLIELASVDIEMFKTISRTLGPLHTSGLGWFMAESADEYETQVANILTDSVYAPRRKTKRVTTSRLAASLKREFIE